MPSGTPASRGREELNGRVHSKTRGSEADARLLAPGRCPVKKAAEQHARGEDRGAGDPFGIAVACAKANILPSQFLDLGGL